jgi:hypothetical protein
MGQGTDPRTGTFLELPQDRDRREPIAPDELRSSCAKAPSRGLSHLWPWAARHMHPSDGNHFHKGTMPMAIPMERVENRILSIRGHRVMVDTGGENGTGRKMRPDVLILLLISGRIFIMMHKSNVI